MDMNSPEMQRLLAAVTGRTEKGALDWEVAEYDPIGFMTEMGVEYEGSEKRGVRIGSTTWRRKRIL